MYISNRFFCLIIIVSSFRERNGNDGDGWKDLFKGFKDLDRKLLFIMACRRVTKRTFRVNNSVLFPYSCVRENFAPRHCSRDVNRKRIIGSLYAYIYIYNNDSIRHTVSN